STGIAPGNFVGLDRNLVDFFGRDVFSKLDEGCDQGLGVDDGRVVLETRALERARPGLRTPGEGTKGQRMELFDVCVQTTDSRKRCARTSHACTRETRGKHPGHRTLC